MSSRSLLQGIFPTQGLNPGLLHCRRIPYQLSHKGSPRILEWVITSVEIGWDTEALLGKNPDSDYGVLRYQYCRIFRSCTNTLTWLEENGLLNEEMLQDLAAKYGLYGDEYITFTTGN